MKGEIHRPSNSPNAARLNTALALHQQGRLDQAEQLYKEILLAQPQNFNALQLLATIAVQRGHSAAALELLSHVFRLNPNHASSLNNRGIALFQQNRLEEALASYDRALELEPDYAEAHNNRAHALLDLKRPEEALESCERALAIRPAFLDALINRGAILLDLKRPEEALASYQRALDIAPDDPVALSNRGNALLDLRRSDEALDSCMRAYAIKPDYADAHWNESLCRLRMGDYERGWREYEWRWKRSPLMDQMKLVAQPLWLGEPPLAGKTILLHAEQGLGDTLQFCRYAPLLAAQGARVVLEVPPSLKAVCQTLAGVDTLLAAGEALPPFDLHTPLLSLPLALGTRLDSIPAEVPYLHADAQKVAAWKALLGQRTRPHIGLAWSGNPAHKKDRSRSLSFAELAELIDASAEFICLQKEIRSEDEEAVRRQANLLIVSERLKDFADTAALIEALDLVITVDTSVAHLAGAMGKPVWILLPFAPDWRWLLDRADSPWYPSARLFRQPQPGLWAPVMAELRRALADPSAARATRPSDAPAPAARVGVISGVLKPAELPGGLGETLRRATTLHRQGELEHAEKL